MNNEKINKVEDWMTNSQKEIITNTSRVWEKKTFKKTVGFWIVQNGTRILGRASDHDQLPDDAIIDNEAWDHEHCSMCWETISEYPDYQHEGYTDGKDWLCVKCYQEYIVPGNETKNAQ